MEPSQTLDATLPQQHLTHAAEGCPSELRSEDLMLGGHEGANPHVGPRVASEVVDSATADILQPPGVIAPVLGEASGEGTSGSKILSRLDIFQLMKGKSYLSLSERVNLIVNTIGPDYQISRTEDELKSTLPSLLSKCETKYKKCKNMTNFLKKHGKWLSETFISGYISAPPEHTDDDSFRKLSKRQQIRSRQRLESTLQCEPLQKRIKAFVNTLHIGGEHSHQTSTVFTNVIESCLQSNDTITEIANKM